MTKSLTAVLSATRIAAMVVGLLVAGAAARAAGQSQAKGCDDEKKTAPRERTVKTIEPTAVWDVRPWGTPALSVGDYNGDGDVDFIAVGEDQEGNPSVLFFLNVVRAEIIPPDLISR